MTGRLSTLSLVAVLGLLAAGVGAAKVPIPTGPETSWETPSGNIVCVTGRHRGRPLVSCTVFSEAGSRGQKIWALYSTGRPIVGFLAANAPTDNPRLGYGRSWAWRGLRCTSQRRGLTCANRSDHGFFLSRQTQRVF